MKTKIEQVWPGWKVVRLLGKGTFGQVYEIERENFGEIEKSALKVITIPENSNEIDELRSLGFDENGLSQRYINSLINIGKEYATLAKLKSFANVVHCEDIKYGHNENGIGWDIYIRMELLTPIISCIDMFNEENNIIKLGIDLCSALIACKNRNIIHRDVKPHNIFVAEDGTFKLGDFGIAETGENAIGGVRIGACNYMAPEVYLDKPYGSAADQYSMGIVLYWLLNEKRLPFLDDNGTALTTAYIEESRLRRFSGEQLPPPAKGSDALKKVVLKACEFLPENRFSSAEEMKAALIDLWF